MLKYRIGAVVWLCLGAFLMTLGIRGWDIFVLKSGFRGYKYSEIVNRIALIFFWIYEYSLGTGFVIKLVERLFLKSLNKCAIIQSANQRFA